MSALTASRLAAILEAAGVRAGVDGYEVLGGGRTTPSTAFGWTTVVG